MTESLQCWYYIISHDFRVFYCFYATSPHWYHSDIVSETVSMGVLWNILLKLWMEVNGELDLACYIKASTSLGKLASIGIIGKNSFLSNISYPTGIVTWALLFIISYIRAGILLDADWLLLSESLLTERLEGRLVPCALPRGIQKKKNSLDNNKSLWSVRPDYNLGG